MERTLLTDFQKSLDDQEEFQKRRGRAAVFTGRSEHRQPLELNELDTPKNLEQDLITYLSELRSPVSEGPPQVLIILEDLGCDWIKPLHKVLGIPLHVFALHWANPNDHVLGNVRLPLGESPDQHFILNYRQHLPVKIVEKKRDLKYRVACNAIRTIDSKVRPDGGCESTEQLISYWGNTSPLLGIGARVHVAILLVDPCTSDSNGAIFLEEGGEEAGSVHCLPEPCLPTPSLSMSNQEWMESLPGVPSEQGRFSFSGRKMDRNDRSLEAGVKKTPRMASLSGSSLFDELLRPQHPFLPAWPSGLTYWCRRLVLARTAATINDAFVETLNLTAQASTGIKETAEFNFDNFERRAWSDKWRGEWFSYLWELREDLELLRYKLYQNVKVISRIAATDRKRFVLLDSRPSERRRGNAQYEDSWPSERRRGNAQYEDFWPSERQRGNAQYEDSWPLERRRGNVEYEDLEPSERRLGNAQYEYCEKIVQQQEDDLAEWENLKDLETYAFQMMERTTQSYLQTVAATGSQFANIQTRSVGRLTGLATLFVPASLCAAVLTLPNFSSGTENEKFWIFWVVSVPLAIILAICLLSPFPSWIKGRWASYRESRKAPATPKDWAIDLPSGLEPKARVSFPTAVRLRQRKAGGANDQIAPIV